MDERLELATDPLGRPRFYPVGQHPAFFREREVVRKLEALPSSPATEEVLEYHRNRLAQFEEQESVRKAAYLSMVS